jgi:hypothetical protein
MWFGSFLNVEVNFFGAVYFANAKANIKTNRYS